jgi:hydrogenase-1 operon protein HyaF
MTDASFRPNPMLWLNEEEATGVFLSKPQDGLTLVGMPNAMRRKRGLIDPDAKASPALVSLLKDIRAALVTAAESGPATVFDLAGLSDSDKALLHDVIGDGDVSVVIGGGATIQASESALTGVWRVTATAADGSLLHDRVEIGDVPSAVRATVQGSMTGVFRDVPKVPPAGVMNALPVLAEIAERASRWRRGQPNHVINFTLLPMTEEDTAYLTAAVGQIPLTIVSGGYGTCRIFSTMVRNLWGVQYLNATGSVILDTLEIGDVPQAATAAREDFEDSGVRLAEIMDAYL